MYVTLATPQLPRLLRVPARTVRVLTDSYSSHIACVEFSSSTLDSV